MRASPTKHAMSAPAVPDNPAFWALFAEYERSGRSATRALARLAETWDEAVQGRLPSPRTARYWARVYGWSNMNQEAVAASVPEFRAYVEARLLAGALDAVQALNRIINGEIADPKLANAMARASVIALNASGYGPPSRRRKVATAA